MAWITEPHLKPRLKKSIAKPVLPLCLHEFFHGLATMLELSLQYGYPRSHSDTPQPVGLLWTSDNLVVEKSTWQHTTLKRGIRIHNPNNRTTRAAQPFTVPYSVKFTFSKCYAKYARVSSYNSVLLLKTNDHQVPLWNNKIFFHQ